MRNGSASDTRARDESRPLPIHGRFYLALVLCGASRRVFDFPLWHRAAHICLSKMPTEMPMSINRLDGRPHFIVRVVGIIVVLPFVLVRDWWRKRRGRR